jgi:hypothetical protein
MGIRRALTAIVACAACLVHAGEAPASAMQQRIKAAFLSKFAAYVEWPANAFAQPESPLVIGVAGAEPIARELDQAVAGRKVAGRPVRVQRLAPGEEPRDCCHILFVGSDNPPERAAQLLAQARGRPVLTVTEGDRAVDGGVIHFLIDDDRVRFDISRLAAERNRLQLRSQLLAVARQATGQ